MEGARAATEDDLARVAALARQAIAELAPMRGGEVWSRREARAEPLEDDLAMAIRDPDRQVLVGLIDDHVVGYSSTHLEELRDRTTLGVVDDLFVEPEARAVGVGEAIMDLVIRWCTERGCRGVDALVLPGNRHSKNFFESFGLTARAILVHRALGPGGAS